MATFKELREASVEQLSQGAAYCGLPTIAVSSGSLTGSSTVDGGVSLIALLGAFLMAGVWMFRRWATSPEAQAPPEPSPGVAVAARQGHGPTNA